ncbi:hypothetical protein F4861DRAFT_541772 [Xylaria intraflava]|nr:hypothetical protein F4861DRAFT_541772 [Xylaria intraflava]
MESKHNEQTIQTIAITSKHSFDETKTALEATIPPLDLTAFVLPPRDFTGLLRTIGKNGQALGYEIGNPLTAVTMVRYELDIAPFAPRRVLLRSDGDKVELKVNPLAPLVAAYGVPEVDAVAQKLDADLTSVLRKVAGYKTDE